MVITAVFGPASFLFDVSKRACIASSRPIDWAIKTVSPNYINDMKTKKERI